MMVEVEDGVLLAVYPGRQVGAGPAIVFSNSLAADSAMWREVIAELEDDARLIRFDTRGHGRSDVAEPGYGLDRLGLDVVAILDRLQIERAIICGLSLGGLTAQWLGVNRPDRVAGLVLANTTSSFAPPELWRERATGVVQNGMADFVQPTIERWFTPAFHTTQPDRVAEFARTIAATPAKGYAGGCTVLAAGDMTSDLSSIEAPTEVIGGLHDPSTPPAAAQALAAAIPGAALTLLDAAHLSAAEAPAGFAEVLKTIIARAAM